MKNIENRYIFGKTLGEGAFGVVKLVTYKKDKK